MTPEEIKLFRTKYEVLNYAEAEMLCKEIIIDENKVKRILRVVNTVATMYRNKKDYKIRDIKVIAVLDPMYGHKIKDNLKVDRDLIFVWGASLEVANVCRCLYKMVTESYEKYIKRVSIGKTFKGDVLTETEFSDLLHVISCYAFHMTDTLDVTKRKDIDKILLTINTLMENNPEYYANFPVMQKMLENRLMFLQSL